MNRIQSLSWMCVLLGIRQGEAIDSYLRDLGMAVQINTVRPTKPIVLVCDSNTVFSSTIEMWLANVQSRGVTIEIQQSNASASRLLPHSKVASHRGC